MAKHGIVLSKLNNLKIDPPEMLKEPERKILMSGLMHAADISNPTMKFNEFRDWGLLINQEFDDTFTVETDL